MTVCGAANVPSIGSSSKEEVRPQRLKRWAALLTTNN